MHIDCHKVKILHHWSANGGHLLSSAVLVEFTLHDHAFQKQPCAAVWWNMSACQSIRATPR